MFERALVKERHRSSRFMDLELYRAAELGNWDVIRRFEDKLDAQRTVNKDTVLHVVSRFCDSSFVVQQILKIKPKLLLKRNAQGETLLHIAARKGHSNVVRAVIHCIKRDKKFRSVLGFKGSNENTALHEAVMNSRHETVKLLVEEDPNLTSVRNRLGQCPLYLAVENGDEVAVALILSTYKSYTYAFSKLFVYVISRVVGYIESECLRTPLHVAAILNFPECLSPMLDKLPNLTKNVDYFGRTALHYAARFNHQEVARQLLRADRSIGYVTATRTFRETGEDDGETAIHVAAVYGHVQVMELILTCCPDCWRMVTHLWKCVIHLAVENEQQEVLDFILRKPWASELVNRKDHRGNTPLHLYVATKKLLGSELVNHPEVKSLQGFTPLDLIRDAAIDGDERQNVLRSELEKAGQIQGYRNPISIKKNSGASDGQDREILNRRAETQQVVATLIITITFAAAFTIPGGYESNDDSRKGYPVFLKKAAFIAFIVSDVAAMMFSLSSLLWLLGLPGARFQYRFITACNLLIRGALLALQIAFVTGLYVAVPNLGIKLLLFILLLICGSHVFLKPV